MSVRAKCEKPIVAKAGLTRPSAPPASACTPAVSGSPPNGAPTMNLSKESTFVRMMSEWPYSDDLLDEGWLRRLNEVAEWKREMRDLMEKCVERLAEVRFGEMMRQYRELEFKKEGRTLDVNAAD